MTSFEAETDLDALRAERAAAETSARRSAGAVTDASRKPGASGDLREWAEIVALIIANGEMRARLFDKLAVARDGAAEMDRQRNLAEERIRAEVSRRPAASAEEKIAIAHEVASAERHRLEREASSLIETYIVRHELDAWLATAAELQDILAATSAEREQLNSDPSIN